MSKGWWKPLFTTEERRAIRQRYEADPKLTISGLAREYGISRIAMAQIVHGDWEDRNEKGERWIEP